MASSSFPRSISIFGFTNTALGACGLVSGLSALIRPQLSVAKNVYQQVDLSSQSMEWLHWAMVIAPISSALMLICGIGLLRKKTWGRTLAIIYGIGSIGFMVVSRGVHIARIAEHLSQPAAMNIILGWLVTLLFGALYFGSMVYCLSRPSVKQSLVNQPIGAAILAFKPTDRRHRR
jgi:hypothetical protein